MSNYNRKQCNTALREEESEPLELRQTGTYITLVHYPYKHNFDITRLILLCCAHALLYFILSCIYRL